jgi:hypothetical protein
MIEKQRDSALTGSTRRAFEDIHTAGVTGSISVSPTKAPGFPGAVAVVGTVDELWARKAGVVRLNPLSLRRPVRPAKHGHRDDSPAVVEVQELAARATFVHHELEPVGRPDARLRVFVGSPIAAGCACPAVLAERITALFVLHVGCTHGPVGSPPGWVRRGLSRDRWPAERSRYESSASEPCPRRAVVADGVRWLGLFDLGLSAARPR